MPEIEPRDPSLKALVGRHLWHAPMSSCSQRVRIVLAEAGKDYESHLIDLEKDEHASEAYQAIHPKGLVPAFVEDGHLYIESIDIIQQISEHGQGLEPKDSQDLLALADAAQLDLKLLTFEFLFRAAPPPPADAVDAFQSSHQNEWLKQFRRDFAHGFDKDRISDAVTRTQDGFLTLNARLSDGRSYLDGDHFTLADVAWMPNVHRFSLMDWPFDRTPYLQSWFTCITKRPSYKSGLLDWQNEAAVGLFRDYTKQRQQAGTDVRCFGSLAN